MPTYLELAREPAWGAEFAPPNLDAFYRRLRAFYGLGPAAIGGKGDNRHLSGYHRSRRWIQTSAYCTNRSYSVTLTGDRGGNENWLAALDATVPAQLLYDACRRLDAAVRAGRLPQVAQWFGSFDGQTVVGWSYGRPGSSDSSHLWHLHISFYRSLADVDHTLLYEILTGTDEGNDDMGVGLYKDADNPGENYFMFDGLTRWEVVLDPAIHRNGIADVAFDLSRYRPAGATATDPNIPAMLGKTVTNPQLSTAPWLGIPLYSTRRLPWVTMGGTYPPAPGEDGLSAAERAAVEEIADHAADEAISGAVVTIQPGE